MIHCPNCHNPVDSNNDWCRTCGADANPLGDDPEDDGFAEGFENEYPDEDE